MTKLLIASANAHKIREMRSLLSDVPYEIMSLQDVKFSDDIPETGESYEENARIKAETIGRRFHLLTLADDSGLEVDALGGRPGIYSARYVPGTDQDRREALIKELAAVPLPQRTARYQAAIALYDLKTDKTQIFTGTCEGYITEESQGTNGFGYDPIFFSNDLQKTFGEATKEEKQKVSHRARAIEKAEKHLLTLL